MDRWTPRTILERVRVAVFAYGPYNLMTRFFFEIFLVIQRKNVIKTNSILMTSTEKLTSVAGEIEKIRFFNFRF